MSARDIQPGPRIMTVRIPIEAGGVFRSEAGRPFRFEAGM